MKNFIKPIIFISALVLMASCRKVDPFVGADAYFKSFSIEKNGVSYPAEITGNQISLSVPTNIDLAGAKAVFTTSELATVTPDPATITDWNSSVSLIVTAHDGKTARIYSYSVAKTAVESSGNFTIKTQADMDAFAAQGLARIEGNLVIGEASVAEGADTIKNVNAFSSLTEVTGNIVINNGYGGTDLAGLANLKSAGNIYIGTATAAANLADSLDVALPALESVGEFAVNGSKVKSVSVAALQNAHSVHISGANIKTLNMPALKNVLGNFTIASVGAGTIAAAALEEVGGSFVLQNCAAAESVAFAHLAKVGSAFTLNTFGANAPDALTVDFAALKSVAGAITVQSVSKCAEFSLPALESASAISFNNLAATESLILSKLETVGGNFTINNMRACTALDIASLASVTGKLEIQNMNLSDFAVPALTTVGGADGLRYYYCTNTSSIDISALTSCKTLYIYPYSIEELDFSKITDLETVTLIYINNLKKIKLPSVIQNLEFNAASQAIEIPELEGLEELTGKFTLSNFRLADIVMPAIKKIGSLNVNAISGLKTFTIPETEEIGDFTYGDYNSNTLSAPKLKKVTNLSFSDVWVLTTINLPVLTEVTGKLQFKGASGSWNASRVQVTNFDCFSALTTVGEVDIQYCPKATDFSGFANAIPSLSEGKWSVTNCGYNPTWQNMLDGNYTN